MLGRALWLGLIGLGFVCLWPASAGGQDPDYILYFSEGSGVPGESIEMRALLDSFGGDIQGWSFGACHDFTALAIESVVEGSTTQTANNGNPVDFSVIEILFEGWNTAVIISFTGAAVLPPGTGYELNIATYLGLSESQTEICYCDVGNQPIFVRVDDMSLLPVTQCGPIVVIPSQEPFKFIAHDQKVFYQVASGEGFFEELPEIVENPFHLGFPNETSGFSMGLAHDPLLLQALAVSQAPLLADLNGGAGADIFGVEILPDGVTVGVVYSFSGAETITFEVPREVVQIDYATIPSAFMGNDQGALTDLVFDDDLAMPPQPNRVFIGAQVDTVDFMNAQVQLNPVTDTLFLRGDCNFDGIIDLGDGIMILRQLFQGVDPPADCDAACDANGDGSVDVGDAIFLIVYVIQGGEPPPPPFPECQTAGPDDDCNAINFSCL